MDQVKIRAAVAAHGLAKNDEVTVAATPVVEGAISNGVFVELERHAAGPTDPEPETPPTDADESDPEPKASTRRRG